MIHIDIICCGKLKEKFWTDACNEYLKRLSAFADVEIIELPEIKTGNTCTEEEALRREAIVIQGKIKKRSKVYALSPEGKLHSTESFSDMMFQAVNRGSSELTFIIGSSNGLSPEMKKSADVLLSFSPMTFPHHLFRVMLLEQIYRCFMDKAGRVYAK